MSSGPSPSFPACHTRLSSKRIGQPQFFIQDISLMLPLSFPWFLSNVLPMIMSKKGYSTFSFTAQIEFNVLHETFLAWGSLTTHQVLETPRNTGITIFAIDLPILWIHSVLTLDSLICIFLFIDSSATFAWQINAVFPPWMHTLRWILFKKYLSRNCYFSS